MKCKNCQFALRTDYSFCPSCGAKVIHERITFKGLFHDFLERYFNVDNTLFRTMRHMFTQPETVILGYLDGIRRKYLNPASLLAIALTLSGISLFIMKKYAWENIDFDTFNNGSLNPEVNERMAAANMELSNFIFLAYVPIIAFAGFSTFNVRRLSFVEHLITCIYILGSWSITLFFIATPAMLLIPDNYLTVSLLSILAMALFSLYVYWRINASFSIGTKLGRSILFLFLFTFGFFGTSMVTMIINILTGVISLQDFIPVSN